MAAAITLQRFSKFLKFRREERESAEQQASLLQALDKVRRSAKTIQRAYLKYRQHLQHCRDEFAARQIQRIAKRRRDYNEFIKRRNAAAILQRSYRAYLNRRSRKRARTIAQLLDRSREQQARRIQTAWCGYKEWRDKVLVGIVHKLVDQVELSAAVLTIQRHLRKFQCRFRIKKKKEDSAIRIQKCWQARRRRETSRAKRRMVLMQQNLAASCLQRTFRRHKVKRKVRGVLRKSTRPLYLRALDFSESFREQFRLPIVKSATVVIQTTWRHHFAYVKEKQRRMAARKTIRRYLKHGIVTAKWRTAAMNLRHRRDAAARTLQHWIRRLRSHSSHRIPSVVNIAEQISATTTIQLWYRRRRYDLWRFLLDRLLVQELPRCIEAVNRIIRCWKGYCARKQENLVRANVLADLIEQQRQSESENAAARVIQRMAKRQLDKRKGQILLHQYRILLRQDMKRRQQRAIVHKYLQEKSQLRKKKQEAQAATLAARQSISINSMESSQTQGLSLDSYTSEASAFSLDENPNNNEILTTDNPVQYWSDEYQRAYLYDPVTGVSTWL
ncbi:hypothetical protein DVH05_011250 [Phytophthora capsici]|nr:hypothetical protein DVH05_011250 [Phytophthora capsici]